MFGRESVRFSESPAKKTGDHLRLYGPGTVCRLGGRGGGTGPCSTSG